jgi:aryl-alcohol dehydrogenase-like predicted oxidoreductase
MCDDRSDTTLNTAELLPNMYDNHQENFRRNLDLVAAVLRLAAEKHVTAGQLALAWLLAQGEDIVSIPGTKRRVNLEQNALACAVTLSRDDLQRLETLALKEAWSGARYATADQSTYGTSRARF